MTREDLEKVPTPEDPEKTALMSSSPQPLDVIDARGEKVDSPGGESDEDVEARLAMESLMRHRKARRRKKIIAASVVGGIAAVALIAWGITSSLNQQAPTETTLSTIPLYRGEFSESVQATGTAEPLESQVVSPEIDGIIEQVFVAEGDTVNEGDTLLTIKNDDLDKAVRQAEIDVRTQKAAVQQAQDDYNATYKSYKQGATQVTNPDTGETTSVAGTTQADVQKALAALDSAKLALENSQETYNEAVAQAEKRTVKAPTSGSIVQMAAVAGSSVGSAISGGQGTTGGGTGSLVQIANLTQMKVKVQVNEVDISKIAVGQTARVTFSALPGTMLDAQVTRISTVASSGDGYGMSYGVVTYDVELLIPEPTPELKPGMTATVEIMMQYVPDALTVPASALATDDGMSYYVYVMTDPESQACERRNVTVSEQSDSTAVIEGDVSEGDLVVLDPYMVPMDGADMGGAALDGTQDDGGTLPEGDGSDEAVPEDGADAGSDADAGVAPAEDAPADDAPAA